MLTKLCLRNYPARNKDDLEVVIAFPCLFYTKNIQKNMEACFTLLFILNSILFLPVQTKHYIKKLIKQLMKKKLYIWMICDINEYWLWILSSFDQHNRPMIPQIQGLFVILHPSGQLSKIATRSAKFFWK